jgi:hypothetical protein
MAYVNSYLHFLDGVVNYTIDVFFGGIIYQGWRPKWYNLLLSTRDGMFAVNSYLHFPVQNAAHCVNMSRRLSRRSLRW